MEKDILIQNLRTKVGEDNCKSISDKTFEGIADVYLPQFADDSKITDETWAVPVRVLTEYAGQKRHDEKEFAEKFKTNYASEYATQHEKDVLERIRVATEKAVEDYKKAHPDKGGEGGEGGTGGEDLDKKVNDAVATALQKLTGADSELAKSLATITDFVKNQTEREKTATLNRVKSELKQHLLKLKANNEACIDDALDDIEYGDTPTFDSLKQSAIAAYEKRYKRYYADGGKPFGGSSTGVGGGEDDSFVKERINQLKKEAEEGSKYAAEMEKGFV
jgi:hypothetical protein